MRCFVLSIEGQKQLDLDLFDAVKKNAPLWKITELLNQGANPNTKNQHQFTPLHTAIEQGNLDVVKLLVRKRANVNTCTPPLNWTPLQTAAFSRHPNVNDIVKFLLTQGANPTLKSQSGRPPSSFVLTSNPELKTLLLNAEKEWEEFGHKIYEAERLVKAIKPFALVLMNKGYNLGNYALSNLHIIMNETIKTLDLNSLNNQEQSAIIEFFSKKEHLSKLVLTGDAKAGKPLRELCKEILRSRNQGNPSATITDPTAFPKGTAPIL